MRADSGPRHLVGLYLVFAVAGVALGLELGAGGHLGVVAIPVVALLYWRLRVFRGAHQFDRRARTSVSPSVVRHRVAWIAAASTLGMVSVFAAALSPEVPTLYRFVPASRIAAVLCLVVYALSPGRDRSGEPPHVSRILRLVVAGLCAVLTLHNIVGPPVEGAFRSVVNEWGLVLELVAFLCLLSHGGAPLRLVSWRLWRSMVRSAGFVVLLLDLAVVAGALQGNTSKAAAGTGGVGLAGMSTNETSLVACAIFVWALGFYMSGARRRRVDLILAASMFLVILLSESRTGLGAAVIATGVFALRNRPGIVAAATSRRSRRRRRMLAVGLAVVIGVGAPIAYDRTVSDATFSSSGSANGSGRTAIWTEYRDSFERKADIDSSVMLVGVGPGGIKDLYDHTSLSARGLRAATVPFLPIHSDLIWLLFAGGLFGAATVLILLIWGYRLFGARQTPNVAVASGTVLVLFLSVDMVQYMLGPCLLLLVGLCSYASAGTPADGDRATAARATLAGVS